MPFEPLTSTRPLFLLVEDNEEDVFFINRAFERAGVENRIVRVKSGPEAIAYLGGDLDRAQYPLPVMVLLDIKMPGTDGFDVLRWIRHQTQFARLCVVMLTSSDEIRDVNQAYQLGATSFLVKPLDFWNAAELSQAVEQLVAKSCLTAGTHL